MAKGNILLSTPFLRQGGVGKREGGSERREKQLGKVKLGQEYIRFQGEKQVSTVRKGTRGLNHKICVPVLIWDGLIQYVQGS